MSDRDKRYFALATFLIILGLIVCLAYCVDSMLAEHEAERIKKEIIRVDAQIKNVRQAKEIMIPDSSVGDSLRK